MADLGDTAGCRRALYELNKTCSADIPERGEFYTFHEYIDDRIEIPTTREVSSSQSATACGSVWPQRRCDPLRATHSAR